MYVCNLKDVSQFFDISNFNPESHWTLSLSFSLFTKLARPARLAYTRCAFRKSLIRVHRANIKSALNSTGRERQYVSRPSIVSHEILEQSASTERLKFIVRSVAIAVQSGSRFYVITGPRKMETTCQISASFLFSRPKLTSPSSERSRCLLAYFIHA